MKNHITINGKDWYPEEIDTLDVDDVCLHCEALNNKEIPTDFNCQTMCNLFESLHRTEKDNNVALIMKQCQN